MFSSARGETSVFWGVTPCCWVSTSLRFGESWCPPVCLSVTDSWFKQYSSWDDWPWRRRHYDRLKHEELLTHRHLVARSTIPLREPQMSPFSPQTDTHDGANKGISANFCCKHSENITLRGAVLCVFRVANMASERNLQVMSEDTAECSWQGKHRDWFMYLTLWSSFEYRV